MSAEMMSQAMAHRVNGAELTITHIPIPTPILNAWDKWGRESYLGSQSVTSGMAALIAWEGLMGRVSDISHEDATFKGVGAAYFGTLAILSLYHQAQHRRGNAPNKIVEGSIIWITTRASVILLGAIIEATS